MPLSREDWTGRKSNALKGLKYGGLGGSALGALALSGGGGEWALPGAIVFGTFGAVGGLVVGAFTTSDRWKAVAPAEWSSRITVAPTSSRGVTLRVAF